MHVAVVAVAPCDITNANTAATAREASLPPAGVPDMLQNQPDNLYE